MARISNPVTFSQHFNISPTRLRSLGVFDPILNVDTRLFIDPLLLPKSEAREIGGSATAAYKKHFEQLWKLLKASKRAGDAPWRQAARKMNYHEISYTSIGYSQGHTHGNAIGAGLKQRLLVTAKEIINRGFEDPELFLLLPLFEEGVGADRISDVTTNIILRYLAEYTKRIAETLKIKTRKFEIKGNLYPLPSNTLQPSPNPIILVPLDILRHLPIATDFSEIGNAAHKNEMLRNRVCDEVGVTWYNLSRQEKAALKDLCLHEPKILSQFLTILKTHPTQHYDYRHDPLGRLLWRESLDFAKSHPLDVRKPTEYTADSVYKIVTIITDMFKSLIEDQGLWKLLWDRGKARHEKYAQLLFFGTATSYCKANDLDITPEAETGSGPVDFKLSRGHKSKVLVEVKLSTNSKLVSGYKKQLEAYKRSADATKAIYLVIDVGNMGKKDEALYKTKNDMKLGRGNVSEIVIVDATQKTSASKL